ncbi:MAG TPA: ECF transporter S component [Caldilineaceae bacterium]|nr:ECF transporter S component [Caldilineaceae bacterium]
MRARLYSPVVYILTSGLGALAFLYPFWLPAAAQAGQRQMAHAADAPLVLSLLVGLCFAVLLLEVQSAGMSAKTVALLGILVAINSVLRFADAALPGPGGFSPIFLLILLGGYVFGARVGFLLGALTLFVSALITGGAGPWLPYQMFTAGWMGMSAPLLRPVARGLGLAGRWGETALLALYGGLWGLLYGVIMNLWFWPYITAGDAGHYWTPGIGVAATVQRYALFYVTTSLVWDTMRLVGNVALVALFGRPLLRILARFHRRFGFAYDPTPALLPAPAAQPAGYRREAASGLSLRGQP